MARKKPRGYGYVHVKKTKKKRKGRHSKRPNKGSKKKTYKRTRKQMMMKLITLFLLTFQSGPGYAVKQLPIMVAPEMTCHTALANNTMIKDDGVFNRKSRC